MKVHHLNCGSMCPLGRRLLAGEGGWLAPAEICCHCLLIEGRDGLILVDTGLGTGDVSNPARLGWSFNAVVRPRLLMTETAIHQIRELGLDPRDVRHIVPTHLDLDHVGGMADFPQAEVHVYAKELQAALTRPSLKEKHRYLPAQWAHKPQWSPHGVDGERWMGFEAVRALPANEEEVLLVPLVGHTHGHCGVAVRQGNGWLLHCGDAYFHRDEMNTEAPSCPLGMRVFQGAMQMDRASRLANQQRLRELKERHGQEVAVFCAHDPVELRQLSARTKTLQDRAAQVAA